MVKADPSGRNLSHRRKALILGVLSLLALLSVVLINGAPLFYFDTFGYIDQGTNILEMIFPNSWLIDPIMATSSENIAATEPVTGSNSTVNGARSALFGLLLAILYHTHLLSIFPILSIAIVCTAVWLPMRIFARQFSDTPNFWVLMCAPLIVASTGSLSFYIAFLMPDILAPVLILSSATLYAFGNQLQRSELGLATAIGLLAVLSHPSHLAMAVIMVPVLAALTILNRQRNGWSALIVFIAIVACGFGERLVFRTAVKAATTLEVTYTPFLTARFIADGPGWTYLNSHCPDPSIQTCALFSALSLSDNPLRLTATNIIFERTAELGSFRILPRDIQKLVAEEQLEFVRSVSLNDPWAVFSGIFRNTLVQVGRNSIQMSISNTASADLAAVRYPEANLGHGRLISEQSWIPGIEIAHFAVYILSLIVIAFTMLWPDMVRPELKQFVLMTLMGILINDFVCGAISQPADRYGARVIWLLPLLATVLVLVAWSDKREKRLGKWV